MPSVKIDVAPSLLDWIGNTVSFEGVDEGLRSRFRQWKNNEKQPTYAQIESLSRKIHIPLGYFFLKTPPQENMPLFEFRTVKSAPVQKPSRDLMDTYYRMAAIQSWMRDYLLDQGNGRLLLVGSGKHEKKPEEIAALIREAIGIDENWYTQSKDVKASFDRLRELFERSGILVLQNGVVGNSTSRKLSVGEFRAFALIDDYAPLIFINNNDTAGGKLFSLLHEAVHIWLGLHSFFNENSALSFNTSPQETLCNAVAAELLAPNSLFIAEWNKRNNPDLNGKITRTAGRFRCGEITIARRALDNRYISRAQYEQFAAAITGRAKKGGKNSGRADYYKTAVSRYGRYLLFALDNSIREGKTPYTEARRLTGVNHANFARLVTELGGMNE
jgi:Zn-dependent peptidase ImmA (M78 family)